ncbi:uncharacterized protein LOC126831656 [Patella vulgata]|uniref:uncharacterized protein LOC126831656 n=1 Tax=Patella vulgata TaxID=6465 RepID=UPI00217F7796|nr:uncharacterized protein LOC126831656 [Patella vulgata]
MDKDKKPGILGFQTKDALKGENMKISSDLRTLRANYKEIKLHLDNLEREYILSKASVPMVRYNLLKDMIKKVTDKKILEKLRSWIATVSQHESNHSSSGLLEKCKEFCEKKPSRENVDPQPKEHKKSGVSGLLQRCKEFAGETDQLGKTEKDLQLLSKQEVIDDNEKKRKEIKELNEKFPRILSRLEQLSNGYEEYKKLPFTTKYSKMKEMIKLVITDETL